MLREDLFFVPSKGVFFMPSEDEAFDTPHPSSPLRVKRGSSSPYPESALDLPAQSRNMFV